MLRILWQIYDIIWQVIIVTYSQILKNIPSIWSHCRQLMPTRSGVGIYHKYFSLEGEILMIF